jgi:ribonuclease Y
MDMYTLSYIVIAALVVFGVGVTYLVIKKQMSEQKVRIAEETAKRILEDAKKDSERVKKEALLEAKDESIRAEG